MRRRQSKTQHPTPDAQRPSTLVIGLGNPILGDDGVGWRIAGEVERRIRGKTERVEVDCVALGGLSLMERMIGYDRVILIDAITTGAEPPGSVRCFSLDALPDTAATHSGSAHDTSLQNALQVGRAMGAPLPDDILVVGVEARSVCDFSEELTPAVAAAVPLAAQRVFESLHLRHRAKSSWPMANLRTRG
jgi:hydrogenase maturation protease